MPISISFQISVRDTTPDRRCATRLSSGTPWGLCNRGHRGWRTGDMPGQGCARRGSPCLTEQAKRRTGEALFPTWLGRRPTPADRARI